MNIGIKLKRIFGILLGIIFSFSSLTSCQSLPYYELDPSITYSDFSEYNLSSLREFYSQDEQVYGIYMFRLSCEQCQKNSNALFGYLTEFRENERDFKVYLYNTNRLSQESGVYKSGRGMSIDEIKEAMIGKNISDISETLIYYVPALYVVRNGVLEDLLIGGIDPVMYLFNTSFDSYSLYDNFPEYQLNDIEEFYQKDEEEYVVYLYSSSCPHCHSIRRTMFQYILELENNDKPKMYYINIGSSSSSEGKEIRSHFIIPSDVNSVEEFDSYIEIMKENKVNSLENTYFRFIPSLYLIKDGYFENCFLGSSRIPSYLETL